MELAPIRVDAVMPGMVRTELWTPVAGSEKQALYDSAGEGLLVRRVGEPEEIAEAFLYLIGNGFSTGAILEIDGGHVLAK